MVLCLKELHRGGFLLGKIENLASVVMVAATTYNKKRLNMVLRYLQISTLSSLHTLLSPYFICEIYELSVETLNNSQNALKLVSK